MRLAISAVVLLLALSACSSPSREFLAAQAANRATTVPADPTGSTLGQAVDEVPVADPMAAAETLVTAPSTTLVAGVVPTTTTVAVAAPTTPATTVVALEIDPQEVENALAELDDLLGSLGSALTSIDQAFEQGE